MLIQIFYLMKINFKNSIFIKIAIYFLSFLLVSFFIMILITPKIDNLPESRVIYDKNNIEIWEIPADNKYRHREFSYDEIPDFYKKSIIAIEDSSFNYNFWISISGLFRSFYNNIKAWKIVEWGSTISSQLIRNSFWLNESRTLSKKFLEFAYSIWINTKYSKSEILRLYVDRLYFWYLNYWIKSASIYYFNKEINNLTEAEQLALITIQKNASKYNPYKFRESFNYRFLILAKSLKERWIINNDKYFDITNEKLIFNTDHKNKLPYITDFVQSIQNKQISFINDDILANKLTIDYELSKKIEEIGDSAIYDLSWKNVKDYWVLVLDKKTNNLLVMIWWKNYYSTEWQVNSTLSLRQPGSALKPFTYLLASKNLWYKPNDTILDLPVLYKTKDDYAYEPKNYSTKFEWEVTLWEALAQSMNVPAVKILEKIWVKTLLDFLHQLRIKSLNKDAEHYWLALTLWDWEVTLYELTRAYSIFANSGKFCDINFNQWKESQCENAVDKKYTDEINYILSNRYLKIWWYPINSTLDFTDINVFFKTGTSRNFRDNWTVGYTDNYIIWVWAGNKDASNMKWVSWATWAWEIFGRVVRFLEKPTKIEEKMDTEKNSKQFVEITSPLNWQRYKIDKFTSIDKQKVKLQFSTNINYDKYFWFLDNKKVDWDFYNLSQGKHGLRLELMKDWEIIDRNSVEFEVIKEE